MNKKIKKVITFLIIKHVEYQISNYDQLKKLIEHLHTGEEKFSVENKKHHRTMMNPAKN